MHFTNLFCTPIFLEAQANAAIEIQATEFPAEAPRRGDKEDFCSASLREFMINSSGPWSRMWL
jgi:hypothetical protein